MAKGKKWRRRLPESAADADAFPPASAPGPEVPEESNSLLCSNCGTQFDRSRTDERMCWLCGRRDFFSPSDAEEQRRKREAERKGLCCPNPDCVRPPELVRNSEEFCGGCGAALEKPTVALWFRKFVEPKVTRDPSTLGAGRAGFVDAAWRLQLTKEEAEAKLDEYLEAGVPALHEGAGALDAAGGGDGAAGVPVAEESPARAEGPRRDTAVAPGYHSYLHRERYRREKALRVKYGVVIACFLGVAVLVLFVTRSSPLDGAAGEKRQPTPEATQTPTPMPTPTPLMVEVSGGEFVMGRDAAQGGDRYESPSHLVPVRPFMMDVYEVTREEYQRCVEAGKCAKPSVWAGDSYPAGTGRLPVTGVTWEDANDYAVWAGKSLPTEEQWEFAARGGDVRLYPWGHEWRQGQANLGGAQLAEVGSYRGASPFGIFDLLGNAQEWTRSEWKKYPDKATYLGGGAAPEKLRVIRGGSYLDSPRVVTAAYRNALRMKTEESYAQTGFRCVSETERR
jgi:formylglycine-generating enzyme required for sulfatase activity